MTAVDSGLWTRTLPPFQHLLASLQGPITPCLPGPRRALDQNNLKLLLPSDISNLLPPPLPWLPTCRP